MSFNQLLLTTGILSSVATLLVATGALLLFNTDLRGSGDIALLALPSPVIYLILANALYTTGWIMELVIRTFAPEFANGFAEFAFRTGLAFSIIITCAAAIGEARWLLVLLEA